MLHVHRLDWTKALRKAVEDDVAGTCFPEECDLPLYHKWRVRKYADKSLGDRYHVRLWIEPENPKLTRASCTCKAHEHGNPCKHIAWVLHQALPEEYPLPILEGTEEFSEQTRKFADLIRGM